MIQSEMETDECCDGCSQNDFDVLLGAATPVLGCQERFLEK